jgi:DNA invertase Pin-like site-specific DNA recombinase
MQRAQRGGWNLVAVDLDIDLSSPHGELFATMATGMALWERRMIGDRTKSALAARRAAGVRLGRPPVVPHPVVTRIVAEHKAGSSMEAIARNFNADGAPTAHGGRQWWGSTVAQVLRAWPD